MGKNKKSLSSKVVTVFNPENDEEFDVYVTYSWIEEDDDDYENEVYDGIPNEDNIDIKQFESDTDEDLPDWVTEELVYEVLIDEISHDDTDDYDDEDEFVDDDEDDTYEIGDNNW